MSAIDDLIDSLGFANIYAGMPVERGQFARELEAKGVTAADVDLLATHVLTTVAEEPSRVGVLAALLRDDQQRGLRLADLREIAAKKAKRGRQEARAPGDRAYVPAPMAGEAPDQWDHDRRCQLAKCRHDGDRRSLDEVATELGVPKATAKTMIERGRTLSAPLNPPPTNPSKKAVADTEAEQAARRERFLADMRAKRAAGGGK